MQISAIILAGGLATRMHGRDKGLIYFQNYPLVAHVIKRLSRQVSEILINANREISNYESFGFKVLQDEWPEFLGPLAGLSLGLQHAKHEYVLTAPCDSPLLPLDLAERLMSALIQSNADIAVASCNGHIHPVFCLCKKKLLPSLTQYLAGGGRRVSAWQQAQQYIEVDFTEYEDAFINLNTPDDLKQLELKIKHPLFQS